MKKDNKKNFLVIYGITLLSVAFVLVLLSYLSSLRGSRQEIANLKEESERTTVSALQSIEKLDEENKALKIEIERLERLDIENNEEIEELTELNENLEAEKDLLITEKQAQTVLVDKLTEQYQVLTEMMEIKRLYSAREYSHAAYKVSLIDKAYKDKLSSMFEKSETEEAVLDVIENYWLTYESLSGRGYLTQERLNKWIADNSDLVNK